VLIIAPREYAPGAGEKHLAMRFAAMLVGS